MAVPLSSLKAFAALTRWPSCDAERVFAGNLRSPGLVLPSRPLASSIIAFARRRNNNSAISSSSKKKKKSSRPEDSREKERDIDEDAFETLFSMLEEDLKNDGTSMSDDIDDDISEEDLEKLQRELEAVLGVGDDDEDVDMINLTGDDAEDSDDIKEDDEEEEGEEEEEEGQVKLKNWQFRRLARALKNGRRKISIKNLAAELCLDRAIVLELLRDPPPNLVMMSASLPDEPAPIPSFPQTNPIELDLVDKPIVDGVKSKSEKELPVHVLRHSWSAQKRLKKVHVDTLERVYRRTKRPTNAMVSSIVQVTNLPRKKVVKWFEDKRNEDGVPEQRASFQRSVPETVSSVPEPVPSVPETASS
ncbi:protein OVEREXPRESSOR OF CATIONIC PEROXIDASE 3 [Euphorbia lathyris]|uniref:protein OVEREXPRESSOR OF CATIONIC PEROXIDASE 3 n=1 Tax=Euphorbia lathyris TaxID=212925 RepID=UPI0033144A23